MTYEEVKRLARTNPEIIGHNHQVIETHISWLIIGEQYVFKIKRPLSYPFLDFSSLEKRKHFCEEELSLNRRLAPKIYLGVLPVSENKGRLTIGDSGNKIIDYCVKMIKMDSDRLMDRLLLKGEVTASHIRSIADQLARFHVHAEVIHRNDPLNIAAKFKDIIQQKNLIEKLTGKTDAEYVKKAVSFSDEFIREHEELIKKRHQNGLCRDVHGDLHSGNIFLLEDPVIFDCLEFNPDFRHIDLLNELAFLCMDLEAFGFPQLSSLLIETYNKKNEIIRTSADQSLFVYYKSFRANVRLKTSCLQAEKASEEDERKEAIGHVESYISLMKTYLGQLSNQ